MQYIYAQGYHEGEYFDLVQEFRNERQAPLYTEKTHWVAVYWVVGGCEGYYVHVDRLLDQPDAPVYGIQRQLVALDKFWDWPRAAEVVADLQRFINLW